MCGDQEGPSKDQSPVDLPTSRENFLDCRQEVFRDHDLAHCDMPPCTQLSRSEFQEMNANPAPSQRKEMVEKFHALVKKSESHCDACHATHVPDKIVFSMQFSRG